MSAGTSYRTPGLVRSPVSGLVGREAELVRVGELLRFSRLCTITGPGGVGKTSLALHGADQAARGFRDGVQLIDLSAVGEPALLPATILARLTAVAPASATRSGPESEPPLDQLLGFVRERELLLIIDTCEHLIDDCARLVNIMLREAPGLTVLATTRQPLDAAGEAVLRLCPLPVPDPRSAAAGTADSVELFGQRAAAAMPGFTVTPDNLNDVITICRRLDGIPLAIELAAAQLRALPLPRLAECIDDLLRLLIDGRRAGPARHQSLRAAIEWSYRLCTPAERLLWARMSVFADGFDIAAAEDVCADGELGPHEILPTLISLVDKNILGRAGARDGGPMFLLPETLREYGAERLHLAGTGTVARRYGTTAGHHRAGSGGTEKGGGVLRATGAGDGRGFQPAEAAVRSRFIAHYLGLAERFERQPATDQPGQYQRLLREHANLRAAFDYALDLPGNDTAAIVLATALRVYWQISGQLLEAEYWLDRAVQRCPKRSVVRARVLSARSTIRILLGDFANGRADAQEAVAMAAAFGDLATAGLGHLTLYTGLTFCGDFDAGPDAAAAAVSCLTSAGDSFGLAQYDLVDALFQLQAHRLDQCYASAVRGLNRLPPDEVWCSSYLYTVQSLVLFLRGEADRAKPVGLLGLAMKHRIGDWLGLGFALGTQAFIAAGEGRHERTAWLLGATEPVWEQAGREYIGVPIFAALHEISERTAREALGDERYAALRAAGLAAPHDYVIARALSDEEQLGDPRDAG